MSIKKTLDEILQTKNFDLLSSCKEPSSWESLNEQDRATLALLFITHGEDQIEKGDRKGVQNFALASQVAPTNPAVLHRQASAYAMQNNIKCLKEASKTLDKTVKLDPNYVEAWQSWGRILVDLGIKQENTSYLYQAHEKFHQAQHLNQKCSAAADPHLLWQWAKCWFHIGIQSGEAVDYFQSLEKFRQAAHIGCSDHDFYQDFGNTLSHLATLLKRHDLLIEAATHYRHITKIQPLNPQGWFRLGCTLQQLHRHNPHPDYYHQSYECFSKLKDLTPEDSKLWGRWAELCANNGTTTNDPEQVRDSFEKFLKADNLDPENASVLLSWAEALLFLATQEEKLEYLHEAENKIQNAITIDSENCRGWYWYGICKSEMGHYFCTDSYYRQALEKFEYALSLDPANTQILYQMALTHFSLGDLKCDPTEIENALALFKQCANLHEPSSGQFFNDWGVSYMKLSELTLEPSYLEEAVTKFDDAIALSAKHSEDVENEWLYNYGCALDFLGDIHDEIIYYDKAIQILSFVVEQEPAGQDVRYHLALALFHRGELNSDLDNLHQAINMFHELCQEDPEDEIMWNDYGMALINLAMLIHDPAHSEESSHLLEQAEQKLQQASTLGNKYAFYNLCCMYSISNNIPAAMYYIERAESSNALPPLAELMNDEWLENLQSHPAFRQFISKIILKHKSDPE